MRGGQDNSDGGPHRLPIVKLGFKGEEIHPPGMFNLPELVEFWCCQITETVRAYYYEPIPQYSQEGPYILQFKPNDDSRTVASQFTKNGDQVAEYTNLDSPIMVAALIHDYLEGYNEAKQNPQGSANAEVPAAGRAEQEEAGVEAGSSTLAQV